MKYIITFDGTRTIVDDEEYEKYIGLYTTELEAAAAYDELAILQHGEFAVLNGAAS